MRSSLNDLLSKSSELSTPVKDSETLRNVHKLILEKKANAEGLKCPVCGGNTVAKYVKSLKYRLNRCLEKHCTYEMASRGDTK